MEYTIKSESINIIPDNLEMFFGNFLFYLSLMLGVFLVITIIKYLISNYARNNSYFRHHIYLVRLTKEKNQGRVADKEFTVQELHEEISKGETVFGSIGGMRAQRGFRSWLLGRNDQFSFEIVASQKKIDFYVTAPENVGRYLEQQIHAYYPDAFIEEVDDYNIFNQKGEILAGSLRTNRDFIFPIKSYKKMDTDPMNSILNVMSKLDKDESLVVQYLVRSSKAVWHKRGSDIVQKVHHKNKSLREAIGDDGGIVSSLSAFVFDSFKLAFDSSGKKDLTQAENQIRRLTAMEEEVLKGIEEKNSKAGLDVNLRIIVSAQHKGKAQIYFDNLVSAFSQYNYYEYGNSFQNKINTGNKVRLINDFIYRRFDPRIEFILNTEELASLFHFPLQNAETPNINWLGARHSPAPANLPEDGIILGHNVYRGVEKDVRIRKEDRRRHMYVIGKSGGGKSKFIANCAVQDILNGDGVAVLDPHGDLIEDILERIPAERSEDVILFRPADLERPMALNLIEYDPAYPEQKSFVINEMINIFDKLYNLKSTGGPIFEQYMRNTLLLIMSDPKSGSTLMEVPKVLADAEFRKMKLSKCSDTTIVDFWKKEAEKAGGDAALANVVPYVTSKLTQFISNDTMRPIIGQQKSSFNMRKIMDEKKILLVDLSKGAIGEMNAYLLGMILIGKILMSALSRTDISEDKRKDFYLYIDEFQNFTTDSICSILSEARKYRLNLTIAHQYLGQLVKGTDTTIRDAVFGNVGTWILFRVGSDDAETMEKEFSPIFNKFDLLNIEKYTAYTKLLIDNTASKPFSVKTPWPLAGIENKQIAEKIKILSRLKYGQDRRLVEAEIKRRTMSN